MSFCFFSLNSLCVNLPSLTDLFKHLNSLLSSSDEGKDPLLDEKNGVIGEDKCGKMSLLCDGFLVDSITSCNPLTVLSHLPHYDCNCTSYFFFFNYLGGFIRRCVQEYLKMTFSQTVELQKQWQCFYSNSDNWNQSLKIRMVHN